MIYMWNYMNHFFLPQPEVSLANLLKTIYVVLYQNISFKHINRPTNSLAARNETQSLFSPIHLYCLIWESTMTLEFEWRYYRKNLCLCAPALIVHFSTPQINKLESLIGTQQYRIWNKVNFFFLLVGNEFFSKLHTKKASEWKERPSV